MSRRPIIFILCTEVYSSALNTGIQRVVRNILRQAELAGGKLDYKIQPIIFKNNRFEPVLMKEIFQPKNKRVAQNGVIKFIRAIFWNQRLDRYWSHQGNILLIPDACHLIDKNFWSAIIDFKLKLGSVQSIIYDLIPITHPQVVAFSVGFFKKWVDDVLKYSTQIITVSKFTADEVKKYGEKNNLKSLPPISHFYLSSNLDLMTSSHQLPPMVRLFKKNYPIFIVVGSIEPRKNFHFILDALDLFWQKGGSAGLIIIGKEGWMNEDIIDRIKNHREYERRLFLVRDASDDDLKFAYKNAAGLIFASIVEGFGLPIIEAQQYGLPVFCSNIPVFREIATGRATFFDLNSPANLSNCLVDYCRNYPDNLRSKFDWPTWQESTERLFAIMTNKNLAINKISDEERKKLLIDKKNRQGEDGLFFRLDEVLAGQGKTLISNIYRKVLKREPDPSGLSAYLKHLETGQLEPIEILKIIRYSPEGIRRGVKIRGLKSRLLMRSVKNRFGELLKKLGLLLV